MNTESPDFKLICPHCAQSVWISFDRLREAFRKKHEPKFRRPNLSAKMKVQKAEQRKIYERAAKRIPTIPISALMTPRSRVSQFLRSLRYRYEKYRHLDQGMEDWRVPYYTFDPWGVHELPEALLRDTVGNNSTWQYFAEELFGAKVPA